MDENFEQYIERLTQEIIDAFTDEPDRNPSMFWTDFIMSRSMRVL